MEIREIASKEEWEGFLLQCKEKSFLHSWEWGEFQKLMRGKVWRFGFSEGTELMGVALIVKVSAKRGTFLLVPHGPVTKISNDQILKTLLQELKKLAKEEGASFIRINPIWERNKENNEIFKIFGSRQAPIQMHPEASWKLALTPPEDELFSSMRKTTRYLIRQASKNRDIRILQSTDEKDLLLFSTMHEKVSLRQHFVPFSLEYLKNEFEIFSRDNHVLLFLGTYKGELVAASFVVFWSGIGFYHHAASLPQYAKLSLPYLLQWEAIKEAKRKGCVLYDFWGYVNPKTQSSHPWAGPTLFKMGFGGRAYEYVKTQDFPFKKSYWITYLFETFRRLRRNL